MIAIEKLTPQHLEELSKVVLAKDQIQFACSAKEFLKESNQRVHLHVIKHTSKVIGFFKLDCGYHEDYAFCPSDALGLRSFVIDKRLQGQGLGQITIKALIVFLKQHYSHYSWLYLTVNCKNMLAKSCYQKAGFLEENALYLDGPAGPQHIMYMPL